MESGADESVHMWHVACGMCVRHIRVRARMHHIQSDRAHTSHTQLVTLNTTPTDFSPTIQGHLPEQDQMLIPTATRTP